MKRGLEVENLANVTLNFKSGRKSLYRNINLLEIVKDELDMEWIVIYWETKSYRDSIRIPKENVDELHYVEDLSKFKDQREDMID